MKDPILIELIKRAEKLESESESADYVGIPTTLCVGGLLVSGEIISGKVYADKLKNLAKEFLQGGELLAIEDGTNGSRDYIHLLRCQFFNNNDALPGAGDLLLWRGKIDSVDGFHVGRLIALKT